MNGIHAFATEPGVRGRSSAGSVAETAGSVVSGLSKCHSVFGFQNRKKIDVMINEKIPPPMSVIGYSRSPDQTWAVANAYWNAANDPPPTSSAGHTSNVLRQLHMILTM